MQLCLDIQNSHKLGKSYQSIADDLRISKGMAWQIAHGYKPGKRVSALLNLEPDSDLRYTRNRQECLDEIARAEGYDSWCNYSTVVLHRGKIARIGDER
jgi:hypothetical protein